MGFVIVWNRDVQEIVNGGNPGRVLIQIGKKTKRKIGPQDYCEQYEGPHQFILARKKVLVDIQKCYPKNRFGIELVNNWSVMDKITRLDGPARQSVYDARPQDDRFLNLYLTIEKEKRP